MRTIDGDALKIALDTFATLVGFGGVYDRGQVMECIDAAPTIGMNNHKVANIIADLLGDDCACNFGNIDEWLPHYCDFTDTCCPDPYGVACWEQYLKYLDKKPELPKEE